MSRLRAELISECSQQSELRKHRLFTGIHQHEATGAISIFCLSGFKTCLADQSGLLIAKIAGDCNAGNSRQSGGPVHFAARNNCRQHLDRNIKVLQHLAVPLQCIEVHELRAAGISHVGDVNAAVRSARQMPDQKSIDIAKQEIASFGLYACARNLVENPANLEAAEIRSERKARPSAVAILSAIGSELAYGGSNARVLPDNRVVYGLTTLLVPDDGSFSLVGNPDRRQIFGTQPAHPHRFLDDIPCAPPDFFRIVLHPSRPGIDLLMLPLSRAHDASRTVEHDKARACRSLINGANVACHRWLSSSFLPG